MDHASKRLLRSQMSKTATWIYDFSAQFTYWVQMCALQGNLSAFNFVLFESHLFETLEVITNVAMFVGVHMQNELSFIYNCRHVISNEIKTPDSLLTLTNALLKRNLIEWTLSIREIE